MATFRKPDISFPPTISDDPRIGYLLGRKLTDVTKPKVVILGFPSDEGVRRNSGRVGASEGPDAIRQALYRFTPDTEDDGSFQELVEHTQDLGNLDLSGQVEQDQEMLGEVVAPYIAQNVIPIILGGGHETAYGHFLGYVKARQDITILNWDAHTDVRELKEGQAHSGSPFRQAILDPSHRCKQYTVAGLLPYSVTRSHLDFITEHGGTFYWKESLSTQHIAEIYRSWQSPLMTTFDLDAVDQAYAPGVSAPAVNGLAPNLWLHAAYEAGRCCFVKSMDIVELNPKFDRDNQSARLAALTVWYFLRGLTKSSR